MANYKLPVRQAGPSSETGRDRQADALAEFQARRRLRHLEELERTNPTDIPSTSFIPQSSSRPQSGSLPGIDPSAGSGNKKKQSGNVRKILYSRKTLKDWLDELPSEPVPPYISAVAPPPLTPPRRICSSCGYKGAYKCPRCAEWSCDRACMEVHERDGGCGVGR